MQHGEDLLADLSLPRNFSSGQPATVEDIDQLMQQISVICQQQSRVLNLTKAVMSERIREIEDAILVGHVSIARSAMGGILAGSNKPSNNALFPSAAATVNISSNNSNINNMNKFRDPSGRPSITGNTPDGSSALLRASTAIGGGAAAGGFVVSADSSRHNNNNNNNNSNSNGGGHHHHHQQQQFGLDYDDLIVSAEEENRREHQLQQIQSGGKSYMTQSSSAAPSAAHLAALRAAAGSAAGRESSASSGSAAALSRPGSGAGDLPSPFSQSGSMNNNNNNNNNNGMNLRMGGDNNHNNNNHFGMRAGGGDAHHHQQQHHLQHNSHHHHHHHHMGGNHRGDRDFGGGGGVRGGGGGGGVDHNPNNIINANIQFFVTVQFKRGRMLTYESAMRVSPGQFVVVGGDRGEDVGSVVACWPIVEPPPPNAVADRATGGDNGAGTQIVRIATITEVAQLQGIQNELEMRACEVAMQKVQEHNLRMRIVDAEYQFDRKKLTFYYQAQQRLDFRVLVRDLFKTFRARIWMELDPANDVKF